MSTEQAAAPSPPASTSRPVIELNGAVFAGLVTAAFAKLITVMVSMDAVTSMEAGRSTMKTVAWVSLVQMAGLMLAAFGMLASAMRRDADRIGAAASLVAAAILVAAAL